MINNSGRLFLAPMEGVVDPLMRKILTEINDFDLCIIEFIRVIDRLVPRHVFHRVCPELHSSGFTASKTPVRVQLLGQDPNWMAENAIRAIQLGSHGIDINFGCPAKTVNKSKGGAVLLNSPETVYAIVKSVKQAVGEKVAVSVKIRLGYNDSNLLLENLDAIHTGGANLLTIHARTKAQGYRAPAYWQKIGDVLEQIKIPFVANGEIWCLDDAILCAEQTATDNLMLGRGILALPNLANVIKYGEQPMDWPTLCQLIQRYSELELNGDKSFYYSSRLKQWLRYLKRQYQGANTLFDNIKTMKNKQDIIAIVTELSGQEVIN
jgi:tRNA-dihydrouridine synthase C